METEDIIDDSVQVLPDIETAQKKKKKAETDAWIKQLLLNVDELEKTLPEYKQNIEQHNKSLEKTSNQVKYAARSSSNMSGSAFYYRPNNIVSQLYKESKLLLTQIGQQSDLEILLEKTPVYESLKTKLEEYGFQLERVVTNELLERGYQNFEDVLVYHKDYDLLVSLLAAIEQVLMQNLQLISELKVFYEMDYDLDQQKPNARKLVHDMGTFKKRFPELESSYLKRVKENIPESVGSEMIKKLEDKMSQLAVGYHEFYQDQLYAFSALPEAVNPIIGNVFSQVQNEIRRAKNMQEVLNASKILPSGMEKLYLLHWVYESLFKHAWKNKDKRKLFSRHFEKFAPSLGKATFHFIAFNTGKFQEGSIRTLQKFKDKGIDFRNMVAHQGIIFDPDGFKKAVSNYKSGGHEASVLLKVDLMKVPKTGEVHIDQEKAKVALDSFLKYQAEGDPNSQKIRSVNGHRRKPETWLTIQEILEHPELKEILKDREVSFIYDMEGSEIDKSFALYFEAKLSEHFSKLFLSRRHSSYRIKEAYRAALIKKGLTQADSKVKTPGLSRALYIAAKCHDIQAPLLQEKAYFYQKQKTPTILEVGKWVQEELELHNKPKEGS